VIYTRYRELWSELDGVRLHGLADPDTKAWLARAPRANSIRLDPYHLFEGYPSAHIGRTTMIRLAPGADLAAFEKLSKTHGFRIWTSPVEVVGPMLAALAGGPMPVERLITISGRPSYYTIELIARLAKMNMVIPE